ncbi:MAG: 30S ribosomal protein S16 [Actinomycetota bacterium]
MVKIRLKRVGKAKQPAYRVVVADSRSPRDGRIIEAIGHYNPRTDPSEVVIDTDRAKYWIDRGAQPSNTVSKLIEIAETGVAPPPARERPSKKVTVAAAEEEPERAEVEVRPEAEEQAPAAPEAEPDEDAQ